MQPCQILLLYQHQSLWESVYSHLIKFYLIRVAWFVRSNLEGDIIILSSRVIHFTNILAFCQKAHISNLSVQPAGSSLATAECARCFNMCICTYFIWSKGNFFRIISGSSIVAHYVEEDQSESIKSPTNFISAWPIYKLHKFHFVKIISKIILGGEKI